MCELRSLAWDSALFHRRVCSVSISAIYDAVLLERTLNDAKHKGVELLYLFAPEGTPVPTELLKRFNGKKVSTKVVFQQQLEGVLKPLPPEIRSIATNDSTPDLIALARSSGAFSRFRTDERFSGDQFNALYDAWLQRSLAREIADEVYAYVNATGLIGFVSVGTTAGIGEIGLIAVSERAQGTGIGSALMTAAATFVRGIGRSELQVATQKENVQAMEFYRRIGCTIKNATDIYHLF